MASIRNPELENDVKMLMSTWGVAPVLREMHRQLTEMAVAEKDMERSVLIGHVAARVKSAEDTTLRVSGGL